MIKKAINEEEYAAQINAGTFRTKEEAERFLEYLRNKYNLSEYDSYINGTTVVVSLEKDMSDYSYFYDMVDAIKNERPENMYRQYGKVSESVDKRGMKQIRMYRAEFENACDDLYYGYGYKFWRTHNNSIEDESIARAIWKAAIDKMSQFESKTYKNMKKNTIRLNENTLRRIVTKSVKKALMENTDADRLRSLPLETKINYIIDVMYSGNYNDFRDSYWDECRESMRSKDWSWVDGELEAFIDQDQTTLEDILNYANSYVSPNKRNVNEALLRKTIAKSVKRALNEIGNTDQGLGAVAQNVDRRTTQMGTVYKNANSTVPQKMNAMGKAMNAQGYLAQAIRNAIANGMSEQQIEAVLKQNMSQNFNPTYGNGTLTWNRR
jgi:hypothetical protein